MSNPAPTNITIASVTSPVINATLARLAPPTVLLERNAIAGCIYEGNVDKQDLVELGETRFVTQAILFEGTNRVRVYETQGDPPAGFAQVEATLEDAYLVLMRSEVLPHGFDVPPSAVDRARTESIPAPAGGKIATTEGRP